MDQNDRLPVAVVLVVDLDVVVVLCTDFDVRHLCSFLSSWSGRLNRPGAAFRRIGACADWLRGFRRQPSEPTPLAR